MSSYDLVNNFFPFASTVATQASSSSVSYNYMLKFCFGLLVVQEISSLSIPMDKEDFCSENLFFREWFGLQV